MAIGGCAVNSVGIAVSFGIVFAYWFIVGD